MTPWRRAIDLIRRVDQAGAEEVVPFARGRAFVNQRLNLVHDANYLVADRLDGATVSELIDDAERIQGPRRLVHRRVNVDDQLAAGRLSADFAAAGYLAEEFVIMVHSGPVPESGSERVAEVSWRSLREARRLQRLDQPWAYPELLDQILAKQELTASVVPTRYFGVVADGLVVSSCELRVHDNTAQVETVETLAAYRHRGYSRAVVGMALRAASAQEFIFLVTDRDDWPQRFYQRLGFNTVGVESRFLKVLRPNK